MLNLINTSFSYNFPALKHKIADKFGSFNSKKVVILTGLGISISLLVFSVIKKFAKTSIPSQQTEKPISNKKITGLPPKDLYSHAKPPQIVSNFNEISINKQNLEIENKKEKEQEPQIQDSQIQEPQIQDSQIQEPQVQANSNFPNLFESIKKNGAATLFNKNKIS